MKEKKKAEVNDIDRKELARLIENGCTSGRLDSEEQGLSKHIAWDLKLEVWFDD